MDDSKFVEALRARFNAGESMRFVFFWGHQPGKNGVTASCFSQWYSAPFVTDGERYLTAEHFMMAEKAKLFGDHEARNRVLLAKTPGEAKSIGREVAGFDGELWRQHRFSIVLRANQAKFSLNKWGRRRLSSALGCHRR